MTLVYTAPQCSADHFIKEELMEQEHVWMSFLYFATVVGGVVLITKYICTALAAKYKMEAEKYKYERKVDYYDRGNY